MTGSPRRTLLTVAAVAVALLPPLYLVAVRTAWGQNLDDRAIVGWAAEPGTIAAFGDRLRATSAVAAVAAGAAVLAIALARRRLAPLVGAAVVMAGANATTQVLKGLPRPELGDYPVLTPSWPSGHATVAMSLLLAALIVLPPALRGVAAGLGVLVVCAVDVGVVAAAWHRPSDVLAANLVALAWAAVVAAWLARGAVRPAPRTTSRRVALQAALVAGALAGVVVVVSRLADPSRIASRAARIDLASYLWASGGVLAVAAMLVVAALLLPIRGLDLAGRRRGAAATARSATVRRPADTPTRAAP